MISTYSGTIYTNGSSVGEAVENGIEWTNVVEGNITLFNIKFDSSLFKSDWTANKKMFDGDIISIQGDIEKLL